MAPRRPARRPALLAREPAEGVRLVALDLLAEAQAAAARLPDAADAEALHDFRVAVRRLRSWLRSFSPWVNDTLRRRWRRALKEVAGSTGAARDAEVMRAWVEGQRPELSPRHRRAADAFLARLAPAEGDPRAAAAAAFAALSPRLGGGLARYARAVGAARRGRFGDVWAAALRDQLEALAAALAAVGGAHEVERAHRARIEGKRLRYLLEPLRRLVPAAAEAVKATKGLQDLLGELHDVHVLSARLGEAVVAAAAEGALAELEALRAAGQEAARAAARRSDRGGLSALDRRARERRDALFAELGRGWLGEGAALGRLRAAVERAAGAIALGRRRPRSRRGPRPARTS